MLLVFKFLQVLDWEEGGRTEYDHVLRVFSKEKEDGERRVLAVVRRGSRGFAFCDALDRRPALPALPSHENVESVKTCMETVWGEVHAGLLTLLKGPSLKNEELEAGPLLHRLKATQEGLELASNTNPLLSQVVGQLLYLLRIFSFS
jgi:cancer susceptibility candidate protein 1